MRVEDVATQYEGQSWSRPSANKDKKKRSQIPGYSRQSMVIDMIDFSQSKTENTDSLNWLISYINLLPEDVVDEKIKESFEYTVSKENYIANKLLFEVI